MNTLCCLTGGGFPPPLEWNGMEWNIVLGLSACLLAGGATRVSPGYPLVQGTCPTLEKPGPWGPIGNLRWQDFPFTGGSADQHWVQGRSRSLTL